MTRDPIAAPSALALSPLTKRFDYVKKCRRRDDRARRKVTEARLHEAECILGAMVDGADVVAFTGDATPGRARYRTVHVLVALSLFEFDRLCELGAELTDDEPNGDLEPEVGTSDLECDTSDFEPSLLGCTGSGFGFAGPDADKEECVPLPDKVEAARARVRSDAAGDDAEAVRNGRGKVVLRRPRWGMGELAEKFQRRMRERRAP